MSAPNFDSPLRDALAALDTALAELREALTRPGAVGDCWGCEVSPGLDGQVHPRELSPTELIDALCETDYRVDQGPVRSIRTIGALAVDPGTEFTVASVQAAKNLLAAEAETFKQTVMRTRGCGEDQALQLRRAALTAAGRPHLHLLEACRKLRWVAPCPSSLGWSYRPRGPRVKKISREQAAEMIDAAGGVPIAQKEAAKDAVQHLPPSIELRLVKNGAPYWRINIYYGKKEFPELSDRDGRSGPTKRLISSDCSTPVLVASTDGRLPRFKRPDELDHPEKLEMSDARRAPRGSQLSSVPIASFVPIYPLKSTPEH